MKKILICLACVLATSFARADALPPGGAEVRAMGLLNGEALACKQMALVDRVRMRVVNEAAKTREMGEIFEAATTERFLAMGQTGEPCPDGRVLAERIEAATRALRTAFGGAAK
jgi:hypothetical protein